MQTIGTAKVYVSREENLPTDYFFATRSKIYVGQTELGRIYRCKPDERWVVSADDMKCCHESFTSREAAIEAVRDELEAE